MRTLMFRYATEDVHLEGGGIVHEGEAVILPLATLNRCPHAFTEPDRFDPDRPDASRHLAFGYGAPRCPGASLA
ncbi:cytochrome P450, partial [Streptomyces sp. MCAF7]